MNNEPTKKEIDDYYVKLKSEVEKRGYHLNPDTEFTKDLLKGLLINQSRYGYQNCPCRLSTGKKEEDLDIICPCDYRDPDLTEFDACYCGLYVSKKIISGQTKLKAIPERRPKPEERQKMKLEKQNQTMKKEVQQKLPIWRCQVCGYLCARDSPPETCPICGVSHERFEQFM